MKQRLDAILVERGVAPSRAAAQAMVMAGDISRDGQVLLKAGHMLPDDISLDVKERPRYVSRGGLKLESVAPSLGLDFRRRVVLDVGSSTGGFTDYALQSGATQVFAVDVGSGQLAYRLRQDSRVVVHERTDIRTIQSGGLSPTPDIAVIDVSFISMTKILKPVAHLIKPGGQIVAMAKPQFETSKAIADRSKGVIKDEKIRSQILQELEVAINADFDILGQKDSGLAGAQGNRERFYLLRARAN